MSKAVVNDLIGQFEHALIIFKEEIERFKDDQWVTGFEFFQVPARQAIHLLECLEFYFAEKPLDGYPWGKRFGGGWWELTEEQLPSKEAILTYAKDVESRVMAVLSSLTDDDLFGPLDQPQDWGKTLLGHYIYALRHTTHHQGQLAALASYHGYQGGRWDL
jgi:uncharacterized damage-inducible protein DinB